jgi:NADPH-dependent 7-cyano-7-deazaguanine reductase QueF
MSRPTIVPATADVRVTATSPIQHLCPFVDEVDNGTITITWRTNGATFELHSLRKYISGFKVSEISHEALTDLIRHDLSTERGISLISVESSWTTADMEVQCFTSPILAGRL